MTIFESTMEEHARGVFIWLLSILVLTNLIIYEGIGSLTLCCLFRNQLKSIISFLMDMWQPYFWASFWVWFILLMMNLNHIAEVILNLTLCVT